MAASIYARLTLLFATLTALLLLLSYIIGLYFGNPYGFALLGLIFAAVFNLAAYYYSDSIVLRMTRARIIQESENPTLFSIVRDVAQKAGIPMPRE